MMEKRLRLGVDRRIHQMLMNGSKMEVNSLLADLSSLVSCNFQILRNIPDKATFAEFHDGKTSAFAFVEKSMVNIILIQDGSNGMSIWESDGNGCLRPSGGESVGFEDIVDLTNDGWRWEGWIVDGEPCGYGKLYNHNNIPRFEGYFWYSKKFCYGTVYFENRDMKEEFRGCCWDSQRYGQVTEWDLKGNSYSDSNICWFKSDKVERTKPSAHYLHSHQNQLSIGASEDEEFSMSDELHLPKWLVRLETIKFCIDCHLNSYRIRFDGLPHLKRVYVDKASLNNHNNSNSNFNNDNDNDNDNEIVLNLSPVQSTNQESQTQNGNMTRFSSYFQICNCPKLEEIRIDGGSCKCLECFEISNLPRLKTIDVEGDCFTSCKRFAIKECSALATLTIGDNSLQNCDETSLWNLPSLEYICLGKNALSGNEECLQDSYLSMRKKCNSAKQIDLRSLEFLRFGGANFGNVKIVEFKNIPREQEIICESGAFFCVDTINDIRVDEADDISSITDYEFGRFILENTGLKA